jgi:hypothetical protein
MFDINTSRLERECYQKWNNLMKQHRSHNVRQKYYQERKMNAWDREYANIVEQMRREMNLLRKNRLLREREERVQREELAIAKREQTLRRRREGKKRAQEKAMRDMENPRRSTRLARK